MTDDEIMKWLPVLISAAVLVASCGGDDGTGSTTVPAGEPIEVADLLAGDGARQAVVAGFVIWDDSGARLCDVIMESYPPQCGGSAVPIFDPQLLDVTLDEAGGVKWTPNRVEIDAWFDGERLVVKPPAG